MSTTQTSKKKRYPLPNLAKPPREKQTLVSTSADFPVESTDRQSRPVETEAKQPSVSSSPGSVEHHRELPRKTMQESPTPLIKIGRVSLEARGRRALNKHSDCTSKIAAELLGTTPRQVRKARNGGLTALRALAKHVSVEEIIKEAKVKASEVGFTDIAAEGDRKSDRKSEGLGVDLPVGAV